eukprot:SAG22_NODE_142_length_17922_cov_10.990406_4_plen_80_part_00
MTMWHSSSGHRDKPAADCWPLPNYRVVKALVYLWDVPANGGATAVVPGSHRSDSYYHHGPDRASILFLPCKLLAFRWTY